MKRTIYSRNHLADLALFCLLATLNCSDKKAVDDVNGTAVAKEKVHRPTLMHLSGTVQINGKMAHQGDEIALYGELTVGEKSTAIVRFNRGNVAEIRANSTVKFSTTRSKEHSLRLFAGTIWSFLEDGASYEIDTGNAVAGVRGTVFFTEVKRDGDAYVCACDGVIELADENRKLLRVLRSDNAHLAVDLTTKLPQEARQQKRRRKHKQRKRKIEQAAAHGPLRSILAKRHGHSDTQSAVMANWCKQAATQSSTLGDNSPAE